MKIFKKIFKGIKKVVKSIGKGLKKGLAKISKALGPVGMLALTLMMPALGGVWASFGGAGAAGGFAAAAGTTAATTTGLLGSVFRGIAVAGNAIGSVYSSVTGMLGSVVKKIPIVGDVVTKVSSVTSDVLNQGRMAVGLPVSGSSTVVSEFATEGQDLKKSLTTLPTTIDDPSMLAPDKNIDGRITGLDKKISEDLQANIYTDPLNTATAKLETTIEAPTIKAPSSQYAFTTKGDFSPLADPTKFDTVDVYLDPYTETKIVGKASMPVHYSGPATTVPRHTIPNEFLEKQNKFFKYADYSDKDWRRVIADASPEIKETKWVDGVKVETTKQGGIDPNYSEADKSMHYAKRGAALGAAGEGLYRSLTASEEMTGGGGGFNPNLLMDTTITSATDYSSAYAGAFQGAGFVGPNEFNSYAQAGYYGGDPYSLSQYRRIAPPQANIRIGV